MALSKQEHEDLLRAIADTSGDTAATIDLIEKLRTDFDERGEVTPQEEIFDTTDGLKWRDKFADLNKKYIDRFFTTAVEVKVDQAEDVKKDTESGETTFDDLFKEREG